jgi:hypothetical protein
MRSDTLFSEDSRGLPEDVGDSTFGADTSSFVKTKGGGGLLGRAWRATGGTTATYQYVGHPTPTRDPNAPLLAPSRPQGTETYYYARGRCVLVVTKWNNRTRLKTFFGFFLTGLAREVGGSFRR